MKNGFSKVTKEEKINWLVDKVFINDIEAISHIPGGGLYKNLSRVFPNNLQAKISKNSWNIPNLFKYIQQKGNLNEKEMFEVFNMGVGLVLIVDPNNSQKILDQCKDSWLLGELVPKNINEESVVIE